MSNSRYNFDLHQIRELALTAHNMSWLIESLGYHPNNMHFRKKLKEFLLVNEITLSGIQRPRKRRWTIEELLQVDGRVQTSSFKKRLVDEGYLEYICAECGLGDMWNDLPISLHLDHIDGNRCNNTLENLRILCPNCHSQTDTYCGKNNKRVGSPMAEAADLSPAQ